MSINSNIVFQILWGHFVSVALLLKQVRICPLFNNQRRTLLGTVNDTDSSFTNTNDSLLTHILLLGKGSLDISAIVLNATMNYVKLTNRFEESLFLFCNFLLYVHLFNSLSYLCLFWDYSYSSFVLGLLLLFINIIFLQSLLYPSVSWIVKAPADCNILFYLFLYLIFVHKKMYHLNVN